MNEVNRTAINQENDMANIVYTFQSPGWSEDEFVACGSMVAVVLNYNKKGMIGAAAGSALNQEYPCYEILMLDDASRDGSEQEMLQIAKSYTDRPGKHIRIAVIFNKKNRTTTGQWNLAVSLSKGKWFGMFCGDDTSRPNRIAVARNLVQRFPTALGLGTDFMTSRHRLEYGDNTSGTWCGTDDYLSPKFPISGCAAWWHRTLLEKQLKPLNLDDWLLFRGAMILRKGDPNIALAWDFTQVTVDYTVGTGVSTELQQSAEQCHSFFRRSWLAYIGHREYKRRYHENMRNALIDFIKRYSDDQKLLHDAEQQDLISQLYLLNWGARISLYLRHCLWKVPKHFHLYFWRMFLGPLSYALTATIADRTYHIRHRQKGDL